MMIRATIGTSFALLLLPAGILSATAADGRTSDHRVGPPPTATVPAPEVTTGTAEAGSALRGRSFRLRSSDRNSTPTPRPLPLYGTRWLVESVIEDGVVAPLDTTPGDGLTPATLVFEEEGRFHGSDGCNQISGDVVVSGDRLEIDTITSTLMLCSWEGLADRQIVTALMADPRYLFVDGRLHLTSDDGPNLVLRPELTSSE